MPETPFAHQWKISENELLPLKESENGYLCSTSVSNIPEFEYFLAFYPNGSNGEHRGETWIFLQLEFKNIKKVEAEWTFIIESSNYSYESNDIYKESYGWGTMICSTEKFFDLEKKFIVDGIFTVKINGIFKFETDINAIPAAVKQKWSGGKLGDEFWERNDNKDFAIKTSDGKEIKIHKIIFDIRSDVFAAMLNSNMKESTENKVAIPDFSFKVVETALKIIYDCNFTSDLSMDELMELQRFFDKYFLPAFKDKVEPLLISQISASTVCRLTNCSIQTNSFKLKKKCMEFLSASFASKTPLADFDDLDKDIAFEILKNAFYGTLETEKQQ